MARRKEKATAGTDVAALRDFIWSPDEARREAALAALTSLETKLAALDAGNRQQTVLIEFYKGAFDRLDASRKEQAQVLDESIDGLFAATSPSKPSSPNRSGRGKRCEKRSASTGGVDTVKAITTGAGCATKRGWLLGLEPPSPPTRPPQPARAPRTLLRRP